MGVGTLKTAKVRAVSLPTLVTKNDIFVCWA
jgi:hypothetical protein